MSSRNLVSRSYLRCPDCGSDFADSVNQPWRVNQKERNIRCQAHGHRFAIRRAVADLLPQRYAAVLETLHTTKKRARPTDVENATAWLADTLHLKPQVPAARKNRALTQLLSRVATLLSIARDAQLDETDVRELYALLAGEAMAAGYRQHVADPARASLEAVNYEKYEDILLRKVMTSTLSQAPSAALIELGSGPGRLLHQYGSTISTRPGACEPYRRLSPLLYPPDTLPNHDRLDLILGVDFAADMLLNASQWLAEDLLGDLVETGRIGQIRATVRDLPLDFAGLEWADTARVACILFQTLGNQLGERLQIEMLQTARRCVGENGIVFVSVFNAEAFPEQGLAYYESIEGSVGGLWALDERAFLSDRGVFSRWLYPTELRKLMNAAGMENASIMDGGDLAIFPEFADHIDEGNQMRYKRRALIAVYSRGIDVEIT